MADKYIAVGTVGSFLPNQEVVGLEKERYAQLVEAGAVRVETTADKKAEPTKKEPTKK